MPRKPARPHIDSISTLVLSLFAFAWLAAACTAQSSETPIPIATASATAISVSSPTQTEITPTATSSKAWATPKPIRTPTREAAEKETGEINKRVTQTRTPTEIPPAANRTPNIPVPSAQYRLVDWTPERASMLIDQMELYPETLSYMEQGYLGSGYYYAFRFAGLAEAEASARFPDYVEASSWRWDSAYNQLQSFSHVVGSVYGMLITEGLNSGDVSRSDLENWIKQQGPQVEVELIPLDVLPGYTSSQIVLIKDAQENIGGGTYLWLVEIDGDFKAFPLETQDDFYLGDGEYSLSLEDLTGDGIPEAIIKHVDWGSFSMHSGSFDVFNPQSSPPKKLDFSYSPRGMEIAHWSPLDGSQQREGIRLQIPFYIESEGACGQFGPTWVYRYNGLLFELSEIDLPSEEEMQQNPRCADLLISTYLLSLSKSLPLAERTVLEGLDHYPLSTEPLEAVEYEYPSRDDLRYNFGLILAEKGDIAGAVAQMEKILENPDSSMSEQAQTFIDAVRSRTDMLSICTAVKNCNSFFDLDELLAFIPAGRSNETVSLLKQMGLPIRHSGFYDLNQDGTAEQWILWPERDTFWVFNYIVRTASTVETGFSSRIMFEGDVESITISPLEDQSAGSFNYEITVGNSSGEGQGIVQVENKNSLPYTEYREAERKLLAIEAEFFYTHSSVDDCIAQLKALNSGNFQRYESDLRPRMDYLLALAYELRGDKTEAANRYLALWKTYPESPYAIMAAAKLELVQ